MKPFQETIITSVTTLLALVSIYILGGEILRGFSFAMILGVLIGTYSSIFVASPILKFFKVSYKTLEKNEEKNSTLTNKDFELPLIITSEKIAMY